LNPYQWIVHTGSWIPLAVLIWDYVHDNLTANPIQAVEQRTGQIALTWLLFSLAVTPLHMLTGINGLIKTRRPLGLFAFFYAVVHFSTFFFWDYGANLTFIWLDVHSKLYIFVGLAALLILIPLAITSTRGMMKRMGKRWKRLHQLIYPAAGLVIAHYIWSVKADIRLPLAYGAVLVLMLALRIPPVRRWVSQNRGVLITHFRSGGVKRDFPTKPEGKLRETLVAPGETHSRD
jgi:sulfoxide reductase heme-binding subunit YedZ